MPPTRYCRGPTGAGRIGALAHTRGCASTCLRVSSISASLSSFETWRWRIFDAIATDRSTASWRICWIARAVSSWIWRSAFLTIAAASARAFCFSSSRSDSASDRLRATMALGLDARLRHHLRRLALQPLQLLPGALRIVERLARSSSCRARAPASSGRHANFASSATRTRNVRIVQMNSPGSGWTRGLFMTYSAAARSAARTLRRESRRLRAGRAAGSPRR